jgi:hypothetical protein
VYQRNWAGQEYDGGDLELRAPGYVGEESELSGPGCYADAQSESEAPANGYCRMVQQDSHSQQEVRFEQKMW